MKAMILAAGQGKRMRPLSDTTPKPLLHVGGKPLIVHLIDNLVSNGFEQIVINHARFGEQFEQTLGDGKQFGATITYSREGEQPLETGGGMLKALPLLDDLPFLAISGDLYTDYPFNRLPKSLGGKLAHLVLTDNPKHNLTGDFSLENHQITLSSEEKLNFGGIGVYHPDILKNCDVGCFSIAPLLFEAARAGMLSGEHYTGAWFNIGTPEQLAELEQWFSHKKKQELARIWAIMKRNLTVNKKL